MTSTLLLSYNEVQSATRRAASGAGLPHGVAEDIGRAAAWLAARHVDAVRIVVDALAAGGQDAILDGLAAIDGLCDGSRETVPLGGSCRLLLIGLAGTAATEPGLCLAADRGEGDLVPLARVSDAGGLPSSTAIWRLPSGDGVAVAFGTARPEPTDAAAHAAALALAAKTYVPASERSRAEGAGAGTIDND